MKTRIGKIARLPREIRSQLNHRLHDGEQQNKLVAWLNSLPETQSVLQSEFEGRPINEQNLSEWKAGGYRDWIIQQESLEMIERMSTDTDELKLASTEPLTDKLAIWVAARYVVAARSLNPKDKESEVDWKLLRELCNDVVALRKGDHSAERLKLERERLELERTHAEQDMEKLCANWVKRPDIREKLFPGMARSETDIRASVLRILDEHLLGRHSQPEAFTPVNGTVAQDKPTTQTALEGDKVK